MLTVKGSEGVRGEGGWGKWGHWLNSRCYNSVEMRDYLECLVCVQNQEGGGGEGGGGGGQIAPPSPG